MPSRIMYLQPDEIAEAITYWMDREVFRVAEDKYMVAHVEECKGTATHAGMFKLVLELDIDWTPGGKDDPE